MKRKIRSSKTVSLKIALIYIVISLIWIFLTDGLLDKFGLMNNVWINIGKGSLFVIANAFLLYRLILKNFKGIEDSEHQLHTLIDAMPDFVNFKDKHGRWIKANKFALELFDIKGVPFKGKKDSELANYTDFYREALLYCEESDKEVWIENKMIRCEEIIPQPDGEEKIFDTIKVPLFHSNGERKGLVVIGRDITDRKKVEKRLAENEQLYRSLFENNADAVCTLDLYGYVQSMNEAAERLIGFDKDEVIGKAFRDFVVKEDLNKVLSHFKQAIQAESLTTELRIIHKEGHYVTLSVKDVPIIINNKLEGIFVIARDITDLKKNEEVIRKSDKLSVVGELASAVAHEIRNPLTSLKGFLQLFQAESSENKRYFEIMLSEIDRINFIVSEFMVLSKPQAVSYQEKNINLLLMDVITLLKTIAIVKSIDISTEFETDLPHIKCEENQIKQVFINLLKNAIEAVPHGGKIDVKVKLLEDQILVSFCDNGCGIPKKLIKKLGEPFYTTKEKGTGLGLMVSYKIVEEHQGNIEIMSEENKGTVVEVTLPVGGEFNL
ncbi:PAS domain-containing sensor histidine kinase [Bacillus taeanensis]|uniref:histidine kinase n=1 Tax=Bacillus taeanensis TaxID=273032 RepID=A0A366XUI6_9BACI|nr:PAS domain S-box protein [Bacillus taeanensis]RBW69792.1 PAS domain-containing sensor histidine kinase [Bacillus taeanensis]